MPATSRHNHFRRADLPAVVALLMLGVFSVGALWLAELHLLDGRLGFPLDDSWIHVAFARNLAAGDGLSLDPGELVAGSTGPLWTALVALGVVLPGSDLLWSKLLGFALHLGGVLLTFVLARRLGLGRGLAVLAALLTVATGWLAWSALSGMEISLFVFLSLAGIVLHLTERDERDEREGARGRPPLSLAVLGVAALARPEGLALLAAAGADRVVRFRRRPDGAVALAGPGAGAWRRLGSGVALAFLAFVPTALFFQWIGGSPLPTTLAAKTGGGPGLHLPSLRYFQTAVGILLAAQPWMTVLAPVGAVEMVRRLGTPRDRGLLPVLWLAGLPLAYAFLSGSDGPLLGNFGRYLFPLLPILVVLGCLGVEPLLRSLVPPGGSMGWSPGRRLTLALALLVLVVPTVFSFARTAALYVRNVSDIEAGDVRMARWLAERLPEDAVVATMDIGALGALLPNRIVDLAGIADPEVHGFIERARSGGASWQDGVLAFIRDRRPDYLAVFPEWLSAVDRSGSPFRRVHTIHVPGNVTLGRDTLVLYSTPWTRHPLESHPEEAGGGASP